MEEKYDSGSVRSRSNSRWWRMICITMTAPMIIVTILASVVYIRALGTASHGDPASHRIIFDILTSTKGIQPTGQMERAKRLAGAIRIQTISYEVGRQELQAMLDLHDYIKQNFPLVHNCSWVQRDTVSKYSLLYTVTGSQKMQHRPPYLLAAHLDVVPANADSWEVDPFNAGIVNDTFVYGRGAIDDKGAIIAILEALEYLISVGERPNRTFFIAFGHDEELLGGDGAKSIADELRSRGVNELDFVSDEGFPIMKGVLPGVAQPVALLGVTEKGYATVELSVSQSPGHSSFPPRHSAIGILSAAINRLENHPHPVLFGTGPEAATFQSIAPEMSFSYRIIFANLWLFSKLVISLMERDPKMNALIRTTTAVTIINGGEKENVVPGFAKATVNHRVHPSQTVAEIIEYDTKIINDPRVSIKLLASREPLPISPFGPDDLPYQLMAATIQQTFPGTLVTPGVLIANTDTRWYIDHTQHIFRFFPTVMNSKDLSRYHGDNERISIEDLQGATDFFYRLIRNADILSEPLPPIPDNGEL